MVKTKKKASTPKKVVLIEGHYYLATDKLVYQAKPCPQCCDEITMSYPECNSLCLFCISDKAVFHAPGCSIFVKSVKEITELEARLMLLRI